jgi:Fe-S-cluster-containing hydrogenase component 2
MARQFRVYLSQSIGDELMSDVLSTAERRTYKPGQLMFHEGDDAEGIFVVRKGALVMSQASGGGEAFKGYVSAGSFIGEMGVIGGKKRSMTVRAATSAHVTWIESSKFMRLIDELPDFRQQVDELILARLAENQAAHNDLERGRIEQFLIDKGMGEATDILLIDEALCVGCDNCEKACAETHGGVSRLNRESGPTFANLHIPMACRHCEDPYCMSDCPADAIHRAQTGQVFIDEKCIGCGNCKSNCPYNAIEMSYPAPEKPGLLSWLLLGLGSGPGQGKGAGSTPQGDMPKLAVKCDSCMDIDGGPSCVRACPTGAAFRIGPDDYFLSARLT